jgi:predicted transposase/invertase (TIGR01784 family)
MGDELLSPLWDHIFSLLFGDQRNISILEAFLKSVLDLSPEDYESLTIVNPFLKRLFRKDKQGIVDVRVNTKSGKVLHIELQVESVAGMKNRVLYYIAKLLWEQLKRGDEYIKLHEVISIIICDHELVPEEKAYINEYGLRNKKTNLLFTDLVKLVILEIPKLPKEESAGENPVFPWLEFFRCRTREEYEMLVKKHPEVREAVTMLKKLSWSESRRELAEAKALRRTDEKMRELYVREEALKVGLAEGRTKGLAEGRTEGLAEGRVNALRDSACKMKALGDSAEKIAAVTGLSPEEIEKL